MVKNIHILFFVLVALFSFGQANRFAGFGYRALSVGCSSTNYLTDAQKFIDSSGITDTVEIRAIKTLTKDLQDSCFWNKLAAAYPLVGSSSTSTKWNLKSPNNQDTSFRITWSGTLTYGSYGVQGNGTNGYGNTHFISYTTAYNATFGIYLGVNQDRGESPMGVLNASYGGYSIYPRTSNTFYCNLFEVIGTTSATNTDSKGLYIATRSIQASGKTFKNGALLMTHSTSPAYTGVYPITIGCRNYNGSVEAFSNNKIGFAFVYDLGLTDAQVTSLNSIIQKFLNTLSR